MHPFHHRLFIEASRWNKVIEGLTKLFGCGPSDGPQGFSATNYWYIEEEPVFSWYTPKGSDLGRICVCSIMIDLGFEDWDDIVDYVNAL